MVLRPLPSVALHLAAIAGAAALPPFRPSAPRAAFQSALRRKRSANSLAFARDDASPPGADLLGADGFASTPASPLHSLTILRGGGATDLPLLQSVAPSAKTVLIASRLCTAYLLLIGAAAFVAPVSYANSALKGILDDVAEDSFDSSLIQSIGAIVVGYAIHIQLALTSALGGGTLSLGKAMGYALLPRILLILWSFLRARVQKEKGDYQFEGTGFLKVNFVVMSWTAFSLLTNAGNPAVSAKVFSTMALIKAMALVVDPVKMTQKIFGVDVSAEGMAQSTFLGRALGNYLAVHATLMLALACGVSPNMAAGLSAVAWTVLSFWILLTDGGTTK